MYFNPKLSGLKVSNAETQSNSLTNKQKKRCRGNPLVKPTTFLYPVMRKNPFTLAQLARATVKEHVQSNPDSIEKLEIPTMEKDAVKNLKPNCELKPLNQHDHYIMACDEKRPTTTLFDRDYIHISFVTYPRPSHFSMQLFTLIRGYN